MKDIRIKELPFELEGKTYMLRCNMNVLADIQDAYNGEIGEALSGKSTYKSLLTFLAAMLNDYADDMGWSERWTVKALGRRFRLKDLPSGELMDLVVDSLTPDKEESTPAEESAKTGN